MSDMPAETPGPVDPAAAPTPVAADTRERNFARPFEIGVMAGIIVLDQITKVLVRQSIGLGDSRTIIAGFLDLTHVQNSGAAFGLLNSVDFPYKAWIMIVVASVALIAIAAYGTQLGFHDRIARLGLALILGGAFGNLLDRAIIGHVTDFVDVYWGVSHFWAFNIADAAINVGAALVLLDMIGLGRRHASDTV
jgi:signal peptidase II